MAVVTLGLTAEQRIAAVGCRRIEASCGGLWRSDRKLIELKGLKLRRDQIVIGTDMRQIAKAVGCCNRELCGAILRLA